MILRKISKALLVCVCIFALFGSGRPQCKSRLADTRERGEYSKILKILQITEEQLKKDLSSQEFWKRFILSQAKLQCQAFGISLNDFKKILNGYPQTFHVSLIRAINLRNGSDPKDIELELFKLQISNLVSAELLDQLGERDKVGYIVSRTFDNSFKDISVFLSTPIGKRQIKENPSHIHAQLILLLKGVETRLSQTEPFSKQEFLEGFSKILSLFDNSGFQSLIKSFDDARILVNSNFLWDLMYGSLDSDPILDRFIISVLSRNSRHQLSVDRQLKLKTHIAERLTKVTTYKAKKILLSSYLALTSYSGRPRDPKNAGVDVERFDLTTLEKLAQRIAPQETNAALLERDRILDFLKGQSIDESNFETRQILLTTREIAAHSVQSIVQSFFDKLDKENTSGKVEGVNEKAERIYLLLTESNIKTLDWVTIHSTLMSSSPRLESFLAAYRIPVLERFKSYETKRDPNQAAKFDAIISGCADSMGKPASSLDEIPHEGMSSIGKKLPPGWSTL